MSWMNNSHVSAQSISSLNRPRNQRTASTYVTTTPSGERVVNRATLTNADGTPHKAYGFAPGTAAGNALATKRSGGVLSPDQRAALIDYLRKMGRAIPDSISDEELMRIAAMAESAATEGLPSVSSLKGGDIITPSGTKSKNTQAKSGFDTSYQKPLGGSRTTPFQYAK